MRHTENSVRHRPVFLSSLGWERRIRLLPSRACGNLNKSIANGTLEICFFLPFSSLCFTSVYLLLMEDRLAWTGFCGCRVMRIFHFLTGPQTTGHVSGPTFVFYRARPWSWPDIIKLIPTHLRRFVSFIQIEPPLHNCTSPVTCNRILLNVAPDARSLSLIQFQVGVHPDFENVGSDHLRRL